MKTMPVSFEKKQSISSQLLSKGNKEMQINFKNNKAK
jgi:hypothetical protein